ncbi:MAG TPA: hypothetical protein VLK82_13445 [Candidatus Tectomicrobia bacterium]|nr:hypothetical protein [Candidatus Tectomicrobia bacterium]
MTHIPLFYVVSILPPAISGQQQQDWVMKAEDRRVNIADVAAMIQHS